MFFRKDIDESLFILNFIKLAELKSPLINDYLIASDITNASHFNDYLITIFKSALRRIG